MDTPTTADQIAQATACLIRLQSEMNDAGDLSATMRELRSTLEYTIGGLLFAREELFRRADEAGFLHDFDDEMRVVSTVLASQAEEGR